MLQHYTILGDIDGRNAWWQSLNHGNQRNQGNQGSQGNQGNIGKQGNTNNYKSKLLVDWDLPSFSNDLVSQRENRPLVDVR